MAPVPVSFEAEEGGFVAANDNDTGDHNFLGANTP